MAAYKDEERKTWYVKFRYINWQGQPKHTTKRGFKSKKEALEYERTFKEESREQIDITVAKLIKEYLEDKKIHVKQGTYNCIENAMNRYVLPLIGELKLKNLTPSVMRKWQNEILKFKLKPSTTRKINDQCSTLFNFAIKFYGMKQNPLHLIESIGKPETSKNFWELEEFERFIKAVDKPKYRIIFLLLFMSGMREGELLALNVGDFDFKNNKISINKSKMVSTGEITSTKNESSVRIIEMPSMVMQEVKDYIKGIKIVPNPLFKMTPAALFTAFNKYIRKSAVKKIRIHDLRHSHASLLINSGLQIAAVSQRLGHNSIKMTLDTYAHAYLKDGERISNFLQDVSQKIVSGI